MSEGKCCCKPNVGTVDKIVRVAVGLVLFSFFFTTEPPLNWLGLLGILPILSAVFGFCFAYKLLGISTMRGGCCAPKETGETVAEKKDGGCGSGGCGCAR